MTFTIQERRERNTAASKRYRLRNPEKRKESMQKYILANPEKIKANMAKQNPKRFMYNGKTLSNSTSPRKNTCSNCNRTVESGDIKRTNLHHVEYDDSNPLTHTVELCIRCHTREHMRLRRESS